jgi:flagellar biogenesis protein FliO
MTPFLRTSALLAAVAFGLLVAPAFAQEASPSPTPPPALKAPGADEFGRLLGYITLLAAVAGAAIYLVKFGIPLHRARSKEDRKLNVLEMRPLGNRQFLIVVGYEDNRMLLGVTPGRIDYLCSLEKQTSPAAGATDFSKLMDSIPTNPFSGK